MFSSITKMRFGARACSYHLCCRNRNGAVSVVLFSVSTLRSRATDIVPWSAFYFLCACLFFFLLPSELNWRPRKSEAASTEVFWLKIKKTNKQKSQDRFWTRQPTAARLFTLDKSREKFLLGATCLCARARWNCKSYSCDYVQTVCGLSAEITNCLRTDQIKMYKLF